MSLSSVVSIVASSLGILGGVGGAIAYLSAVRGRTTIEVLNADNAALRHRVETLEAIEIQCTERLARAEMSVKVLTETVTNAQAVAELLARVDVQHADIKRLSEKVDLHFTRMLTLLETKVAK
ncbi:MAG TPA: hypothetical protein VMZ51_08120 [Acidimicrobiales bacterium]|nr:hypothetical protein [Acidimicrobiales bacterium]